jgi:hypothetical protein
MTRRRLKLNLQGDRWRLASTLPHQIRYLLSGLAGPSVRRLTISSLNFRYMHRVQLCAPISGKSHFERNSASAAQRFGAMLRDRPGI